jgi:hypothetical protein
MIKEEAFSRAVAKLSEEQASGQPSWDDIRIAFEKESGQELGWFFDQWIGRKGLSQLHAENPELRRNGSRFEVSFEVLQKNGVYILDLPVTVSSRAERVRQKIRLDEERKSPTFDDEPLSLVIDRDYDLPRLLTDDETHRWSQRSGQNTPSWCSQSEPDVYQTCSVQKQGAEERSAEGLRDDDLRRSSLVLLGSDNPVIGRFFGRMDAGRRCPVVRS